MSISDRNRKVALSRWKKVEERVLDNLNSLDKNERVLLTARLLGFIAGDGHLGIRKEKNKVSSVHYEIYFYPDHESLIKPFMDAVFKLYGEEPKIKKKTGYYVIRFNSKTACLDLRRIVSLGIYSWRVPFDYLSVDEFRKEWLRAFFDCEASLSSRNQIQLQSVNKEGIYDVKKLLELFGIESKIYIYKRKNKKWNDNYILCILKREFREKFFKRVGFFHKNKSNKLKESLYAKVPESG